MSTAELLVNRMILRWEQERARDASLPTNAQRPVITISREYGGGRGLQVARHVADLLGFAFWDANLVERIASSAQVGRQLVEVLDERSANQVSELVTTLFEERGFHASDYLRHLSRILLAIGRLGDAVIVGRGAQFVLDPRRTLRVRLFAPLEYRVQQIADEQGLTEKEARREVMRVDAERASFCAQHFNRDVRDLASYDLVLDFLSLGPELCAELVVQAFRGRFR
jgi:cytidylate kinase